MNRHKEQFHALSGDLIEFKPLEMKDVPAVHAFASDPAVSRFIGWKQMGSIEETEEHVQTLIGREVEGTHLYSSIIRKSSQTVIGTVILFNFDDEANQAEIGYVIGQSSWGNGFGTELAALVSGFGFRTLGLHKLRAEVVDANIGSLRILAKNGYEQEGRLRDHYFIEGCYHDAIMLGRITPIPGK
ncbi:MULTISPECIES: GNAT family N-acetyltransferase [Sporosarcina]|uniref:GNAT family N-acetyltransferase n=1 Tax=Sporosarcina TaxID=1569 RepID=UPI00058CE6FF|nr:MULTISPECIES: GNAT family protein [Sporosarcina]WJY27608.1 GNAT family protein [Sporosarcina sp. 0.2-SM1T-5]